MARVCDALGVSERRACRVLGQPRPIQRRRLGTPDDEIWLAAAIVEMATIHGRYGCRRITALLGQAGWAVNEKRVEPIWRREGLTCHGGSRSGAGSGLGGRPAFDRARRVPRKAALV